MTTATARSLLACSPYAAQGLVGVFLIATGVLVVRARRRPPAPDGERLHVARELVLLALVLVLAACSSYQDPGQVEGNIIAPGNFKAGSGVITGVGVLPNANKGKAQPSSTGRRADPNLYRLTVRMDEIGRASCRERV